MALTLNVIFVGSKTSCLQKVQSIALILTMGFIGWQAFETKKSANAAKKSAQVQEQILIHNLPYVDLRDFYCVQMSAKRTGLPGKARCYGTRPVQGFRRIHDCLFNITLSKQRLEEFQNKRNDHEMVVFYFYKKGLINSMLDFVKKHERGDITAATFTDYLNRIRTNPILFDPKEGGVEPISLEFDTHTDYGDPTAWFSSPRVLIPGTEETVEIGRIAGQAIIKDIEDSQKIVMYYTAWEYIGILGSEKIRTHYFGYLYSPGPETKVTFKHPLLEEHSGFPGYKFQLVEAWTSRKQFTE